MNKTLTITVICLVAMVMGFSAVSPALAHHNPAHNGNLVPASGCPLHSIDWVCVASDVDNDNVCESSPFLISAEAAKRMGIIGSPMQPCR